MAKTKTRPCDAAEYLETTEDMAACLEAALEDGEPAVAVQASEKKSTARRSSRRRGNVRHTLPKAP